MAKKRKRSIGAFVKMILGDKKNPLATVTIHGKSKKQARAKAARFRKAHLKNVFNNPTDEILVGGNVIKVVKKISGGLPGVIGLGGGSTHARKKPSWARGVDGKIYRTRKKGGWREARPGELSPSGL